LKSGRLPLWALVFDPSPRETGQGARHLANRAGADRGCGTRASRPACPQCRPLLWARESASRRTRRVAGAPVPLGCTCDSKGAPGVSRCTCGIQSGVPLAAEVRPGSNYAPPRCAWHLQVRLRGEYGPQNARCTWRFRSELSGTCEERILNHVLNHSGGSRGLYVVVKPCNLKRSFPFTETRHPGRAVGPMPSKPFINDL
jgi:hypothetical protein